MLQANKRTVNIVVWVVVVIVAVAAIVVIATYITQGKHLQAISLKEYVIVNANEQGGYDVILDYDRLVQSEHLPSAKLSQSGSFNESRFAELKLLKSIVFMANDNGDQTYTVTAAIVSDELSSQQISQALFDAGLKLESTQWVWTKQSMDAASSIHQNTPKSIDISRFFGVSVDEQGAYHPYIDTQALLSACGFDKLPNDDSNVQTIKSLSFSVTDNPNGGYGIALCSTMADIFERLMSARIEFTNTQFVLTSQQIMDIATTAPAQQPTLPPTQPPTNPPAQLPTAPIDPVSSPAESAKPTSAPTSTPTTAPTKEPPREPQIIKDKEGCIDSLYDYDQTFVRRAIKKAKERHYGSDFESSEVLYNYFITAKTNTAEYANCFRLVLNVRLKSGSEYMIADVYNLNPNREPTLDEVVITIETTKTKAKSTDDFNSSLYSIATLNGGSLVFKENKKKNPYNKDGLVFADSLDTALTTAELWSIPATESKTLLQLLGYARNEIFARCGHLYKSPSAYWEHFSKYDWYEPIGTVDFNGVGEKCKKGCANIELIKEMENLIKAG